MKVNDLDTIGKYIHPFPFLMNNKRVNTEQAKNISEKFDVKLAKTKYKKWHLFKIYRMKSY